MSFSTVVAKYVRESTIWKNARFDKRTLHFVEMRCSVKDYDCREDDEPEIIVTRNGKRVHKLYCITCVGVNGVETTVGKFFDDKDAANELVKKILNHKWYTGWKRVK